MDELSQVLEKNNKLDEAVEALQGFLRLQVLSSLPVCARACMKGESEAASPATRMQLCLRIPESA